VSRDNRPEDEYDPRRQRNEQRYLATLTDTGRSRYREIRRHQFADSIGGDSSNYRF
jgi:hypothetical protein